MRKTFYILSGLMALCLSHSASAECWSASVTGPGSVIKGSTKTYNANFSAGGCNNQFNIVLGVNVNKKMKYRKPNNSWTSYTNGGSRNIHFTMGGNYKVKGRFTGNIEMYNVKNDNEYEISVSKNKYKYVFSCDPSNCI